MKTRKEVVEEFNKSNVFILGTTYETFGVVLVESLAMGVPVIVTDCGGSNDIMNRQVGIVTKQNDVEEMYNSMIEIYKKYDEFEPGKLREYSKLNFSESKLSKKLIKYYYEVLS